MALSARAKKLVAELGKGNLKMGDLKQRGKEIKKDHQLAMELSGCVNTLTSGTVSGELG